MIIPDWVEDVFHRYVIAELTYVGRNGPMTVAVLPVYDEDKGSLNVFPPAGNYYKVKCVKRNPKVAILCSNPKYSGVKGNPVVLVQGEATVHEEDLDENLRYFKYLLDRLPDSNRKHALQKVVKQLESPIAKFMMDWYLLRIHLEIKSQRILAWQSGDLEKEPEIFEAK